MTTRFTALGHALRTALEARRGRAVGALRRGLDPSTEPRILFPAIAIVALTLIWGTTLNLIGVERSAAEHTIALSSHELAATYESQVVRALREIDQTLKVVKYTYERDHRPDVLQELSARAMLLPNVVFVVSIADDTGAIVASTRPPPVTNVGDHDDFQRQRHTADFSVGRPQPHPESGEWTLRFSRRLDAADGSFAGAVMVSVDAAYFVSGYESSKLGEHGVLGVLGTDGVFLVRRSGETVSSGDLTDFTAVKAHVEDEAGIETELVTNAWDGVPRYTSARQLYDFPLAVIVGLSADEQLAATRRNIHVYLWRALGGSVVLILVLVLLGRTSWQLALSRRQAVEEQIAHTARVEYLAYHDGLTTLPNRSLFGKLLSQNINRARRYNEQLAVLFLDLDRFKYVNDTLGHEAGDQLLQEVATRLKACLRESDTVARLGGDEFIVLLPELTEEKYVATVAQKILSAVARPFVLFGQEFRVTASIGISTYPQDGLDEQTLTKHADVAMYRAKEVGKNNFQFYSEQLNLGALEQLSLESGLRQALAQDEFELHYQTKRDIPSGRITGVEALLRWRHPALGMVAPMQFIPVAEESGLIIPIGRWVLRTACQQNVAWQMQGLPRLIMAVNLTASQFSDDQLLPTLAATLADTGMDPHLLELEIAEATLMSNVERAVGVMNGLKALGIRIAIDDFGFGYSALATFSQFPLDTIKIDRSFIRGVSTVADDKNLAEAIIAMGRALSRTFVAQGVETKEQADFVRDNACDQFQGFYLNRPLPAGQIAELLRTQPSDL